MKKGEIVGSIICGLVCIFALLGLLIYKKNGKKVDAYFILDNNTNYSYSSKKGFSIISDDEILSLNLLYKTYVDGINIGNYYFSKVNSWNLFDKKNNYTSYDGYLFGYYGKKKIDIDSVNYRSINQTEKKLISDNFNITNFDYLITNQVYEVDLNNDYVDDKVICLSNNFIDTQKENQYNLIITIIDDEINAVINESNVTDTDIYKIKGFFNFDNSKYKYMIIEKINNYDGDIESYRSDDKIYEYKNNNYQEVKLQNK